MLEEKLIAVATASGLDIDSEFGKAVSFDIYRIVQVKGLKRSFLSVEKCLALTSKANLSRGSARQHVAVGMAAAARGMAALGPQARICRRGSMRFPTASAFCAPMRALGRRKLWLHRLLPSST